jgi:capsule polysaccharide export protein KpsE/RkpR
MAVAPGKHLRHTMAYAYDHNKSLIQRAHRLKASLTAPLALAEARLTQVEAELRQTLAEEQISNLEAQASYLAARVCQLEAELAEVRTQRDNLEVERDEWKRLAQRLLTPKRSWWWPFS